MKDFDAWNEVKKNKNEKQRLFFKERDVWWMNFGLNIGDEEDGKGYSYIRPVLILKKFNGNLFWGCAISSKLKEGNKYYVQIRIGGESKSVIISQFRLYDSKRLDNKMGVCSVEDSNKIKKAIKDIL
jgi:mRNA interferase MazF